MRNAIPFRLPRSSGELVYALLVAGMLCGMMISLSLWMTGRAFPHLPCVAVFAPFPQPFDAIFFWATALVSLLSAFVPDRAALTWMAIGGCVILALQDQMRWQPWFYQYLLMLTLAAIAGSRSAPPFQLLCRIVMVSLYLWSGLHKLTPAYAHMYEATFVAPLTGVWPDWAMALVRTAAPAGPWLEIGMALALCFRTTRKAGVLLAVAAHLVILLLTGPAGIFQNAVVWPWNLIMAALVVLLFWNAPEFGWKSLRVPRQHAAAGLAVLLAGIMPVLSIPEKWDRYLSFHLYSGSERRMLIVVDDDAAAALPEAWKHYLKKSTHNPEAQEVHFLEWSLDELGVPPPGDQRHLLALGRKCAAMNFAQQGRVLFYTDFSFLVKERGWDTFTPQEIRVMREIPKLRQRL